MIFMKWKRRLALLLSVALLSTGMMVAGGRPFIAHAAVEGDNLLINGDFEQVDDDGKPAGWQTIPLSGSPTLAIDESVYQSGTQSYKLSAESVSRVAFKQEVLLSAEQQGKPFRLQLWMKTENLINPDNPAAAKAYGRYQIYNSAGARIGAIRYLDIVQDSIDWTLSSSDFTLPTGAVRIAFEGFLENTTGAVWYDDIRLFEVLPDPPADGNLLPNGGFETVSTSANWSGGIGPAHATSWVASGNPVFAVDETVFRNGSRSVRIHGEPPNNSRGAVVLETTSMNIGKSYLISGWVKTQEVSGSAYVRFQYTRDGQSINVEIANDIGGTTDWTYFSRVLALPGTTDNPSAPLTKLVAFLENSTGTVWFDDLSIREHIPLEDFSVSPTVLEMHSGSTAQLAASFIPDDAANRILLWQSSHPQSVAVDQEGLVSGISTGFAILAATSLETNETRRIAVTVDPSDTLSVNPYTGSVSENGELLGTIEATDSSNAPIGMELAIGPENGVVTLRSDGTFTYYPTRNYSGSDSFTVKVSAGEGGPRFVRAEIDVAPILKPPALDLLWYSTNKGTARSGVLGNVVSPEPGALTWTKIGEPLHGEVIIEPGGSFLYTPAPEFIGYDSFSVMAATSDGMHTEGSVNIFVVPSDSDLELALTDRIGTGVHPRVLATTDDFTEIRGLIETDPYMEEWYHRLRTDAEAALDTEPSPYLANGGNNGPIRDLLINLSLMYQLTGELKYAERAIEELESIAEFADWGGRYNNMLSLTYVAYSAALAYDWLYDAMNEGQRAVVEDAINKHVFAHALDWYNGVFLHNGEHNNMNFVINGSFALAALALLGEDGTIGEEAAAVLQGVFHKLQIALRYQGDDGAWPEGPSYWQYATQPLFLMMAAMETAIGTDYGLSDLEGMDEVGDYPLHLRGPGGSFNFNDGDIIDLYPQSLWLAKRYNKPEYAWHAGRVYEETQLFSPFYLLLYEPGMFDVVPAELDRTFSVIEAIAMRSGWEDPNSVYAAMRGFNGTMLTHIDLDAGTFVFDALGERWALDLGNENYNLPGFWQLDAGTRWTYYRKGAQGHNTVVINPTDNPVHMQDYDAPARLIASESSPRGAFGILDMTERYPNDAVSYRRGMMLTGEREQLIIQDEYQLKTPSELYWFMHTAASISIIEGGRAAILRQKDKTLYVKMLEAPEGATFLEMAAEPLPGTPNPDGQTINHGVRKLAVHMTGVERANVSIWMAPLREGAPLPSPEETPVFAPLGEWTVPAGELPVKPTLPTLDSIRVNGEPVADFDANQTYYEVVVPFEQSVVPDVDAQSAFDVTITKAGSVPGKTYIDAIDPSNSELRNRYTLSFIRGPIVGSPPEMNRWTADSVRASASPQAHLGYTPDKTIDGDPITRWTSEARQWIEYNLGEVREVGAVSIAFFNGNTRTAYFSLSTSVDGETWSTVYDEGRSSGLTSEPEVFHFDATEARYVRINALGNSASRWNNITEVGIFRPIPVLVGINAPAILQSGAQEQLSAMLHFYDGREVESTDVTFTSSDAAVLSIDNNGMALGQIPGTIQLTATDHEYGLTGVWTMEVKANQEPDPGSSGGNGTDGSGSGEDGSGGADGDDNEGNFPAAKSTPFSDIAGHWAESLIKQAAAINMVNGYPNRTFLPDASISRQEFTVMLMNVLLPGTENSNLPFTDSDQIAAWAASSVAKAIQAGIIGGYEDGSFRPAADMNRTEMAVMIARALQLPVDENAATTGFADDNTIPQWAKGLIESVRKHGLMQGRGNNRFMPEVVATRAEVIAVLIRALNMKQE